MKITFLYRLVGIVLITLLLVMIQKVLNISCFIRYLFHIPCPACGMTRAWIAALHFDFEKACYYHPLFFTVPMIILYVSLYDSKYRSRVFDRIIYVIIIGFFIVYLLRMTNGGIV